MRSLSAFELAPIRFNVYTQLAMKFSTRRETTEVAELLHDKAMGTRCATDGKNIFSVKEKLPIIEIPNFDSPHDAAVYSVEKRTPPKNVALAAIYQNDDTVVINSNHICADGSYLIELNKLILGDSHMKDRRLPVPISPEQSVIDKYVSTYGLPTNGSAELDMKKIGKKRGEPARFVSHYGFVAPYKTLMGYDEKKNKVTGITDSLWSSVVMSACAYNDAIDKFGTFTCVNLRSYMNKVTYDNTDTFSKIAATVPMKDWDETLQSVCKRFRKQFKAQTDDLYRNLKTFDVTAPPYDGLGLELSNVGTFYAKGPIKDLYAGLSMMEAGCLGEVCLLSYTLERDDRKDCIGQVRYPASKVTYKDAQLLSESMKYFIQNIPIKATVKQAVEELKEFQKSFRANH